MKLAKSSWSAVFAFEIVMALAQERLVLGRRADAEQDGSRRRALLQAHAPLPRRASRLTSASTSASAAASTRSALETATRSAQKR